MQIYMQLCMHETCAYRGKYDQGWTHQRPGDISHMLSKGQTCLLYVAVHPAGLTVNGHASKHGMQAGGGGGGEG